MRLLLLCHEFPPYGGGAAAACGNLVRCWTQRGIDVDVVTTTDGSRFSSTETNGQCTIHRVYGRRRSALDNVVWVTMPSFLALGTHRARSLMRLHTYDHVFATMTIPAGAVAYLLRKLKGPPYTVLVEGSDVPGYNPDEFRTVIRLFEPVIRMIWRAARDVVSPSEGMRALAARTAPGLEIQVIPHGVDTGRFSPSPVETATPSSTVRLLTVTRLVKRKGLQFALDAVAQLVLEEDADIDLTWAIAGDGNYREVLEARAVSLGISDRVHFLGQLEGRALVDAYRGADLFVLPSLTESFGVVLIEAMACGLPIVATRVGGIPEVVIDGENGVLVEPSDPEAIRAALRALIHDAERRGHLREKCLTRAREVFAWESIADRFLTRAGLLPKGNR